MKIRKKAVLGFTLAAILTVVTAQTTFAEFYTAYDSNRKAVNVSGTTTPGKAAVITIGKDENDSPTIAEAVKSDINGSFEIDILLPFGLPGGKYYVNVSGESESQSFMYIDEELISASLPGLNSSVLTSGNTARDLEYYLTVNSGDLAIDAELFSAYSKELSDILFLNYPAEGINQINDFANYYYQSLALAQIAKGEDLARALESYGVYFQFDAKGIYNSLSDSAKARISARLNGDALFKEKAEICFKNNAIMSQIDTAATWEMLRNAILGTDDKNQTINDNFSILNPDTVNYMKLTDKNKVFKELYNVRSTLLTIADVKSQFESIAKTKYQAEHTSSNPNSGNSGGGGGGAGSGGGGSKSQLTITSDAPIQLTEADAVDRNFTEISLKDIDGHWAANDIQKLCKTGILKGYEDGRFDPDNSITRAEFAVILSRAFSLNAKSETLAFSDITPSDWYYTAVMKAMQAGVINGFDGRFNPELPISRQDMCVMLYRAIGTDDSFEPEFSDSETISGYAKGAVGYLAKSGIVNGTDGNCFSPFDTATRAEVAAIINRYLHKEV